MTAGPQTPYDTPRNIELLRAANDGARLFRAVFVSFAVVALYFLIIALSADDELLFKDGPLRAPILNVSVRASHYFIGAPCILLLLHFNVLIQASLLVGKVTDYKRALCPQQVHELKPEMLRLLLPVPLVQIAAGYSSSVPQWALKLFNFLTLSVLPLVTLGVLRTQFLAFQDSWITGLHSVVLVTDGLLVAAVWQQVRELYPERRSWGGRNSLALVSLFVGAFLLVGPLSCTLSEMTRPDGSPLLRELDRRLEALSTLDVQNKRLYLRSEVTAPEEACRDATLALNLAGRSYVNANLSESILCNAILTGAQLQGANLREARLDGADLRDAALQGADLRGASQ